jgi:hypothetical protein
MAKRYRGQWCWCCDRILPNERFSGSGHARHLCRKCAKLGADELAYRQAKRALARCLTWEGLIRRKSRTMFERLRNHTNARVRALAERAAAEDTRIRVEIRARIEAEQSALESILEH